MSRKPCGECPFGDNEYLAPHQRNAWMELIGDLIRKGTLKTSQQCHLRGDEGVYPKTVNDYCVGHVEYLAKIDLMISEGSPC